MQRMKVRLTGLWGTFEGGKEMLNKLLCWLLGHKTIIKVATRIVFERVESIQLEEWTKNNICGGCKYWYDYQSYCYHRIYLLQRPNTCAHFI